MINISANRFASAALVAALVFCTCATGFSQSQEKQAKSKTVKIKGKVVDRKKYNLVIDDGKQKYKVVIANVGQVMLKLNRPLFDLEKKTVSVVPEGMMKGSRVTYPITTPLFVKNTFAHQRQLDRFTAAEEKRLTGFVVSTKKLSKAGRLDLVGELKTGSGPREYSLETDSGKQNVMLGPGGQLSGLPVTRIQPGDSIEINVMLVDNALVAQSIKFQPVGKKSESQK